MHFFLEDEDRDDSQRDFLRKMWDVVETEANQYAETYRAQKFT